jgi:hypothetical protein
LSRLENSNPQGHEEPRSGRVPSSTFLAFVVIAFLYFHHLFAPTSPSCYNAMPHNLCWNLANFWHHKNVSVLWMLRLGVFW